MDAVATNPRLERGLAIAKTLAPRFRHVAGDIFFVPSQTGRGGYLVDASRGQCSCPDAEANGAGHVCKHRFALRYHRHEIPMPDGSTMVSQALHISYPQGPRWTAAQCAELDYAQRLSRNLCNGIVSPRQFGRGKRRIVLGDAVHCLVMKTYRGLSGRRSMSDLRASKSLGFIQCLPAYNTLYTVMGSPFLTPLFRRLIDETARPLAAIETGFAADATGFSTLTYAPTSWFEHKHHGDQKVKDWVKLHAMCGVQTNVITSAIVSPRGDSTQFEALLDGTVANDFDVQEAYVDKGYLKHTHLATVHDIGGKLFVPFKSNSSGETGDALWDSLFHLYSYNREAFQSHYGKRQNVEATFSGIKRKFGPAVRSRSPVAQRNEVYVKVLCWNISMLVHSIFELGIEAEFWKGRR